MKARAREIHERVQDHSTKLGDLRNIAKEVKVDHELAKELWKFKNLHTRLLAILIMDKKQIQESDVNNLIEDIDQHEQKEKIQLADWLMANQLTKHKSLIKLLIQWEDARSSVKRRIFWYYQARLRWMGKTDFPNTEYLLAQIKTNIMKEPEEVQWAMNYTAGQIGKWQEKYRKECINIGLSTGLYKDEIVAKNCTPNYLPEFIRIEAAKIATQT